jgi:transposase
MREVFCGVDWAEGHHDVALVDGDGQLLAKERISDDLVGFTRLLELMASFGDESDGRVPVAIETMQGLLVAALRAANVAVFPINPLSVARYRDRYSPSRAKSDAGDALVLANILRTDAAAHRRLPADSESAQAIRVLARAHQDAIWDRQQAANKLRSLLRQYFPAFLATFTDLTTMGANAVLTLAPTPQAAATLRPAAVAAALHKGGRRRGVPEEAKRIVAGLRAEQLRQPLAVEQAMGLQGSNYGLQLAQLTASINELEKGLAAAFEQHPDAAVITSFPGLGTVLGARLLGEIGDDRARFASARGLKAFAGTAPVTRASGARTSVTMRVVRNKRLNHAAYLWALPLLLHSPPARAHYDRRRAHGDSHTAASRNLVNRQLGMLYHCLATGELFDEAKAYPTRLDNAEPSPVTTSA